jgi:Fe-S cluster assembly ATP-binding protein
VRTVRERRPQMAVLLVTHYAKLLDELVPDVVHILVDGRIVAEGTAALAAEIDRTGYDALRVGA